MTVYALHLAIRYDFDRPTGAGRQLFRVLPAHVPGLQAVRQSLVTISPDPGAQSLFIDFFGTRVTEAAMPPGLNRLDVVMRAVVERTADHALLDISPPVPRLAAELALHRDVGPRAPHHFVPASPRIPASAAIADFARSFSRPGMTTREVIEAFGKGLHGAMTFDAKATQVDTPPDEAFSKARGVCQDFAQIMVGGLRSLGIPAAYVAGYLRTDPPPGKPRLTGADAMHAWVRAWAGEEMGWVDYDPTNACFARNDHIDVGFGRDYADVAPVTGMLRLDGSQTGRHSVDIEALT